LQNVYIFIFKYTLDDEKKREEAHRKLHTYEQKVIDKIARLNKYNTHT